MGVMNMTKSEAIEMLDKWGVMLPSEAQEAVDMAIDALSEPSGDLISREGAIKCIRWGDSVTDVIDRIKALPSAEAEWIPCKEGLPDAEDCPMDCIVTRKNEFIGNFVDMAVAEADGTWSHEDWKAIVLGDVESGRKTGLISTRDNEIIAWMPLIQPYREDGEE